MSCEDQQLLCNDMGTEVKAKACSSLQSVYLQMRSESWSANMQLSSSAFYLIRCYISVVQSQTPKMYSTIRSRFYYWINNYKNKLN